MLKNCKYDILLSIQYDKIIKKTKKAFNFHTGLLPSYGGVDILYHTLKNKEKEQGITFHKITKNLDCGPVISKITYPVAEDDGVEKLYKKLLAIAPFFVLSCLNLLEVMSENEINNCYSMKPKIYKSSQIDLNDRERYKKTGLRLKKIYK